MFAGGHIPGFFYEIDFSTNTCYNDCDKQCKCDRNLAVPKAPLVTQSALPPRLLTSIHISRHVQNSFGQNLFAYPSIELLHPTS